MNAEVIKYLLKKLWVEENQVFQAIGRELSVSRQFVQAVYWGRKRHKAVEKALLKRGAPLFSDPSAYARSADSKAAARSA